MKTFFIYIFVMNTTLGAIINEYGASIDIPKIVILQKLDPLIFLWLYHNGQLIVAPHITL